MSRTLRLPDDLYERLQKTARERGLPGIEQLLETWDASEVERTRRAQVVQKINKLRTQLFATNGEMPDCVTLIR